MFLFKKTRLLQDFLDTQRNNNKTIGFIPTMGALHEGHLSLVKKSRLDKHLTVCSIFVNPSQFNQREDFEKYPREMEKDIRQLMESGCDVVFHPAEEEMSADQTTPTHYDFGNITNSLEGLYRPGHFDGVITIVKKLFEAVTPDHAYFGQKDFQQCKVVEALIRHFGFHVILHIEPTVREAGGLAMSSRNARLSAQDKADALLIYETLNWIKEHKNDLPVDELRKRAKEMLSAKLKPEYVEIAGADSFEALDSLPDGGKALALIAAWCGDVRLIDNLILND